MPHSKRKGFTLIELLVVIAIIAILIGLLLPAVQKVRDVSNRLRCGNNLKQLSLGMHSYATFTGWFPAAYESQGTLPGWGWGTAILPYIEQDNLYQTMNVSGSTFGNGETTALPSHVLNSLSQTPLAMYRCPAEPFTPLNPSRQNHGNSNYRAVSGPTTTPYFYADQDIGGVCYQNSRTKILDITDGASNTVVLGECSFNPQKGWLAAIWVGMTGYDGASIRISDVMWAIDASAARINGTAPQAFGSRHPGGAMFAFGDGSVRLFRDTIDPNAVRWVAGRNDGVIVHFGD